MYINAQKLNVFIPSATPFVSAVEVDVIPSCVVDFSCQEVMISVKSHSLPKKGGRYKTG